MHRLMVEENIRKKDAQAPLSILPKPCDYFDLIGGTSTGGCVAFIAALTARLICILQDNCINAWTSTDGCRRSD